MEELDICGDEKGDEWEETVSLLQDVRQKGVKKPRKNPRKQSEAQDNRRAQRLESDIAEPVERLILEACRGSTRPGPRSEQTLCSKPQDSPSASSQDSFGKAVMVRIWENFEAVMHFELVPNGRAFNVEPSASKWTEATVC
ncbi:hypothetical protein KIN20_018488 [Parelaphostrongylus tenuis]|uniref:Uncharacterized protein n=1 Tax=Parelaphostrongylus tenuis TaxID=148309 RepID=A0AAD5MK19_PARTN|nr:hypothetical protein KIN20_018488 [Parelaphostrongylus tenuis]